MAGRYGTLAQESQAERARRNGISPALATSREARDAAAKPPALIQGRVEEEGLDPGGPDLPLSAPKEWHREMAADDGPIRPVIKGAVKVEAFPERCKYPFPEIARDGGVWRIDPAAFKVTPTGVKQAAGKWADRHELKVKIMAEDGQVYVQFTRRPA